MLCEMPVLNLPDEFTSSNDTDTRREGLAVSTLRTATAIANLYIGFELDNLPTFKNISKTRPRINFMMIPLQVSFPPAGNIPMDFDPIVNPYILIEVCINDAYSFELILFSNEIFLVAEFVCFWIY